MAGGCLGARPTGSSNLEIDGGGQGGAAQAGAGGSSGGVSGAGGVMTMGAGGSAGKGAGGAAFAGAGGSVGAGGYLGAGGSVATGGSPGVSCSSPLASRVRVTEVDVGAPYAYNEVDNNGAALGLTPLAISPMPAGGSRLAFLGQGDSQVHVVTLDVFDHVVAGSAVTFPAYDLQDIYADNTGGALLVSRAALGATAATGNCGNIGNLCGVSAIQPVAATCQDMYLVHFTNATEDWAAKLTDTTATQPAYGVSATVGSNVVFVWSEYAHNGRIAFDGANYGAYFGAAIAVPNQMCLGASAIPNGVNIHQGDRLKVVSGGGVLSATSGFGSGCSHSGYERLIWDPIGHQFVAVCKNDAPTGGKTGKIAFAPMATAIFPVDLAYSQLGGVLETASRGGFWIITSDIRGGQPAGALGLADIHLLHAPNTASPDDVDVILVSDGLNDRVPHLAAYGSGQMLAAWETSSALGDFAQTAAGRQMYLQILDLTSGTPPAGSTTITAGPLKLTPSVLGSRYQDFRAYPDGSVAYPAPGSGMTRIKILRVLGCSG